MRYNKSGILQYADCLEIADMLGIEKNVRGKNVYIPCPEHIKNTGRKESKIDNCILSEKGYYCFSCHAKGNAIDLVKYHLDVDEEEACRTLSTLLGDEEMFVKDDSEYLRLPFSREELQALELRSGVTLEYPVAFYDYKENQEKLSKKTYGSEYTAVETQYYPLATLMKEDPEGFAFMISGKIKEAKAINELLLQGGLLDLLNQTYDIPYATYQMKVNARKDLRLCGAAETHLNYFWENYLRAMETG